MKPELSHYQSQNFIYFKKKIRPISLMIIDWKIPNKILANQIYKKGNIITKWDLSQECKVVWTLENQSA